ncbi:LysR family transcriptional regulator [Allopusillimonas ginsengisoli]|nr:LysR family transcriptional regulator [Allopusillimonas ginsengisoli]
MKLVWLEDLLTLAEAGSFSKAAALRNITQPAFSRRIQLLETWLDVQLVDRRATPMRLTPAAQQHIGEFRRLLHDLHQLRSRIRAQSQSNVRVLLVTQHSLTMTQLPPLIKRVTADEQLPRIDFNVRSENRDDCVTLFMEGHADLLLCMEEPDSLLLSSFPNSVRLPMGTETLIPVSALAGNGKPLHVPRRGTLLRLLGFPAESFLGRLMYKECVASLAQRCHVELVHESVFLAGIKEMVLAGLGMAWLPASLVQRELKGGTLKALGGGLKSVKLELGLYRGMHPSDPKAMDRMWRLFSDEQT